MKWKQTTHHLTITSWKVQDGKAMTSKYAIQTRTIFGLYAGNSKNYENSPWMYIVMIKVVRCEMQFICKFMYKYITRNATQTKKIPDRKLQLTTIVKNDINT